MIRSLTGPWFSTKPNIKNDSLKYDDAKTPNFTFLDVREEMNRLNATLLYRELQLDYMQITYLRRILEDDASISIVSLKKKGYILQVR